MGNYLQKSSNVDPKTVPSSIFNITPPKLLGGDTFDMKSLKDEKAILFVNVASKCGLTPDQYKGLVALDKKYRDQKLKILGFPCAQFANQEFKTVEEIRNFVKQFNVEFPLFELSDVNGSNTNTIFKYLKLHTENMHKPNKDGTEKLEAVGWNFGKFLVDSDGKVVRYAGPRKDPSVLDEDIAKLVRGEKIATVARMETSDMADSCEAPPK